MKFKSLLYLLFLLVNGLQAETPDAMFQRGNNHYKVGEYESAINWYNELLEINYTSPELHYNLANAYYKTNQIGLSILHYEKALKLKPNQKDYKHNLKLANAQTVDKIEALPELFLVKWWRSLINMFSLKTWQWIAIAFIWFSLLAWFFYYFIKNPLLKRLALTDGVLCFVLALVCVLIMFGKYQYNKKNHYAIIMAASTYAKNAPNENSEDAFILHEGAKVKLLERVSNYQEIKLADGNVAWIELNSFKAI